MRKIFAQITVVASILIPNSAFAKSGTSFQTRLLVLEKSRGTKTLSAPEDIAALFALSSSLQSSPAGSTKEPAQPNHTVPLRARSKMLLPGRRGVPAGTATLNPTTGLVAQLTYQKREVTPEKNGQHLYRIASVPINVNASTSRAPSLTQAHWQRDTVMGLASL